MQTLVSLTETFGFFVGLVQTVFMVDSELARQSRVERRGGKRAEFPRCFLEKVDLILADTSGKMDTWRNPVVSQLNSIL
jgi:hypothetical protein